MKIVVVPKLPVRSIEGLAVNLSRGYQIEKFLSRFFLFGGVGMLLVMLATAGSFPSWGIVIFFGMCMVVVVFLAYKRLQYIKQKTQLRCVTYEQGSPVVFNVVEHRREFVWYMSSRVYAIVCKCPRTGDFVVIKSAFKLLWESCPVSSQVYGFMHEDSYLFGEMLGVKFQFSS